LGAHTTTGSQHLYKCNAAQAGVASIVLYLGGSLGLGLFSPSVISDHWGPVLSALFLFGLGSCVFMYFKGLIAPTDPKEVRITGNVLYDFFWGVELNPRINLFGMEFDFKLFYIGRIGMLAWVLVNLSFAAKQYEIHGTFTDSMILINIFHALYIFDWAYQEEWYLKTIDVMHDHFGFYICWGVCSWLPFFYTMQAQYLVANPVVLGPRCATAVSALCAVGYFIFRDSNNQRLAFRACEGKNKIWGKAPMFIRAMYYTEKQGKKESLLLTSGWWGVARHFNYVADLMMCLSYGLVCGTDGVLPYFYFIFMFMLLVTRSRRDDSRCSDKYGEDWKKYCAAVRWHMFPFVW